MVLVDAVSKLEMSVWILNHISRSITWSLLAPEMYTTKEQNNTCRVIASTAIMALVLF